MRARQCLFASTLTGIALLVSNGCTSTDRPSTTTTTPLSTRITSGQMCTEAGGTYSQGRCSPAPGAITAQQLCERRGGTYFAGGDYCEVPPIRGR
jgi:hypothetical protein